MDDSSNFLQVCEVKSDSGFLELPWEDVIFSRIFVYLSLFDISRCRRISKIFNELCSNFFKCCHRLDFSLVATRITETAFIQIAATTSHLKVLIMENCKATVKDTTIVELLRHNPQLAWLNLGRCNSLSNRCLVDIGEKCPKLNKLYLRECRWVSPEGVINVALSCKNLQMVDLSGCWELNDDCITVLIKSCQDITHLSMNGCYGITDMSLHVASCHLSKLINLEIDGCWRISNHAIQLIGEYCRSLSSLNVKDCRDVTEASLARLRIKGVHINVEPVFSLSAFPCIQIPVLNRSAMHMMPFLRFNPS